MQIESSVLTILDNSIITGNLLVLPAGQLERKMYVAVNKVLEAAGGKWNKKAKGHVFDGDPVEIMDQIVLTGEVTTPQDMGYFPTPKNIVTRLLEFAAIEPGMSVLEPSAGQGAIAEEIAKITYVDVCEIDTKNVAVLADKGFTDIGICDWLEQERPDLPENQMDRVVMNPPFARQADIKHVNHALKFLKPGGRLVSVMSAGVLFRENRLTTEFRDLVASRKGFFEKLPAGSFKASGTEVNTVIVVIYGE